MGHCPKRITNLSKISIGKKAGGRTMTQNSSKLVKTSKNESSTQDPFTQRNVKFQKKAYLQTYLHLQNHKMNQGRQEKGNPKNHLVLKYQVHQQLCIKNTDSR